MGEIHLDFLNFNTILLFLIILLIGGYLYYEIHTIKLTLNDLNLRLMQRNNISSDQEAIISPERSYSEMVHPEEVERNPDKSERNDMWTEINNDSGIRQADDSEIRQADDSEIRQADDSGIRQQMTRDDSRSDDSRSDDSRSDDSRSDDSRSDDSRSDISQSEIEKDYGKTQFDNETNNASIDDILSDKVIITDDSLSDILNVDKDLSNIDEFMQSMKKNEPKKEYIDMTVSELKKILVELNLPVSGNKTKLIERILENKK
jgi:hypothetical protein